MQKKKKNLGWRAHLERFRQTTYKNTRHNPLLIIAIALYGLVSASHFSAQVCPRWKVYNLQEKHLN
jgi:hypothetical protein